MNNRKTYQFYDWLCNVRVVLNDKKTAVNSGTTTASYMPQVVSVTDYYSFGSQIAERTYDPVKPLYRFGFNDKENINEIYGSGNFQDYGARMYDTRLGRFVSPDPLIVKEKKYSWLSSYQFAGNTPIRAVDVDGLEPAYKNENGAWVTAGKLQRVPTAQEVKMIEGTYHKGTKPIPSVVENYVQGIISSNVTVFTSIVFPIINQFYTTFKEGLHPGAARNKENQLDWAVPYKLEEWKFKPLKKDITETFEGKEGYERGGKEIIDATVDRVVRTPIKPKNVLQEAVKQEVEYSISETIKRSIDKIYNESKNNNKKIKK